MYKFICKGCAQVTNTKRKRNYCSFNCYNKFRKEHLRQNSDILACSNCTKEKDKEQFYLLANGRRSSECMLCCRKRSHKDAASHRQRHRKRSRDYYHKNIAKCREKMRERNAELRKRVLNAYSDGQPKCNCPSGICQESREEFLAIDHVNGGGNKHRQSIKCKAGTNFYRWLAKNDFPAGFRVLCHNCNFSFGFRGYCPHEKEVAKSA